MRLVVWLALLLCFAQALPAQELPALNYKEIVTGLDDAQSLYISMAGNLFIAETGRNRILKIARDGTRLDSLGRLGSGDYQFDRPIDIDATNELKIYVSDYNNRRIQVFDRRFQYLSTVELPPRVQRDISYSPLNLQVNYLGQLFFYDEQNQYIYKFNSSGRYEQRFDTRGEDHISTPTDMASIDDVLYVSDSRQNIIHMLTSNGLYQGFLTTPSRPKALSAHDNEIWTLTGNEINSYSRNGHLINSFSLEGYRDIRDIAIYRDHVYMLSGQSIYLAEKN
ncbi:MAG: NHL repeat-containing protein [Balneolales bacterium]